MRNYAQQGAESIHNDERWEWNSTPKDRLFLQEGTPHAQLKS